MCPVCAGCVLWSRRAEPSRGDMDSGLGETDGDGARLVVCGLEIATARMIAERFYRLFRARVPCNRIRVITVISDDGARKIDARRKN